MRVVRDVDEAIAHINQYGSGHSDSILTTNPEHAEKFLNEVDSATVYSNASTRFTDGGEFGFGAEIGISTDKLHARGPMGLRELTSYKYKVRGSDKFDPDIPEAIIFPGWGVPGELYWSSLEDSSFASAEIFDYGFFEDEESPMKTPLYDEEIPPVIVGHSMGALFAIRLALQNLGAVHRLILMNPFPKFVRTTRSRADGILPPWNPCEAVCGAVRRRS